MDSYGESKRRVRRSNSASTEEGYSSNQGIYVPTSRQPNVATVREDPLSPAERVFSKSSTCYLSYITSHGAETEFALTDDYITLGRKATNSIRLNCVMISKEHAVIERSDDGRYVILICLDASRREPSISYSRIFYIRNGDTLYFNYS